ncbi:molybdenum cofactor biosynthesis protein [Corynebacterium kutscheri]|uniref:Molybdopterin molybdenumtransferase n=2 Tax=Corynebacterium kutscheri TaxID=35755 RepID=A0A0F6R234_9CORY|nr:molybdopterin biosynthesis enzyme [Corynebacterium kutscheri]VEH05695.1 molybdenum cofactor biosynthesis protein [Corynebacterium kutscheri]VEH10583.1 molybdenum cofactor biosynthesis protein [Corynebacterium kutscheri]VEH81590.1 molybdenum cofactor biosynthesis protein [Corynebacterium kutscheri]
MLTVEEYLQKVLSLGAQLPAQKLPIAAGIGGILAEDLTARFPVPPFDNSAMDGFAVRAADIATAGNDDTDPCAGGSAPSSNQTVVLKVVGDIPAGAQQVPSIGAGECARIMTGAPLPPGSDSVVPVELTDHTAGKNEVPQTVTIYDSVTHGKHVRRKAENCAVGEKVLPAGLLWTPAAASSAASLGYAEVSLIPRPRVAVLATGSELVAPGQPLGFGQIPDSNSILVTELCKQFGAEVIMAEAVSDDPKLFSSALCRAAEADIVVTTGGVSAGAYEVVRQVTEGEVQFTKVAMQPGKPQACGTIQAADSRKIPLLGLPGNPVSAYISAWLFVRPLIELCAGRKTDLELEEVVVEVGWRGAKKRRQYIPVIVENKWVRPAHRLGSGSHLVASLALSNAIAIIPAEVAEISPGETVQIFRTDRFS